MAGRVGSRCQSVCATAAIRRGPEVSTWSGSAQGEALPGLPLIASVNVSRIEGDGAQVH